MEFPQVWTWVPEGAPSLRKQILPQRNRPGRAVARSMSSGNQVLLGQYGATNKTCSTSSLILHSVCASRLTGGNAYLRRLWASCVPMHPCRALPRLGSRTTGSGWFLEMQTGPPEQLRTVPKSAELPGDGVSTPLEVLLETACQLPDWTLLGCGWHEGTSDASDSRGGGGGRVATCDMRHATGA